MPRMHTNRNNNSNGSGVKRPYNFDDYGEDGSEGNGGGSGGGPSTSRRMSEQIE